jgi:chaperonin GroES
MWTTVGRNLCARLVWSIDIYVNCEVIRNRRIEPWLLHLHLSFNLSHWLIGLFLRSSTLKTKTSGGIVLPDTAKEKPQQGEVLAVGSGRIDDKGVRQPLEVKVGDKVLFAEILKVTEVKIEGVEYLILD